MSWTVADHAAAIFDKAAADLFVSLGAQGREPSESGLVKLADNAIGAAYVFAERVAMRDPVTGKRKDTGLPVDDGDLSEGEG